MTPRNFIRLLQRDECVLLFPGGVRESNHGKGENNKLFWPVWKSKFYGAFVLNRRVDLHAIDATPARWRGDAGSSPLDRHMTHWLISTQVLRARARRERVELLRARPYEPADVPGAGPRQDDRNDRLLGRGLWLCGNQPVRRVHPTILH